MLLLSRVFYVYVLIFISANAHKCFCPVNNRNPYAEKKWHTREGPSIIISFRLNYIFNLLKVMAFDSLKIFVQF